MRAILRRKTGRFRQADQPRPGVGTGHGAKAMKYYLLSALRYRLMYQLRSQAQILVPRKRMHVKPCFQITATSLV